jgi:hypothetical protein
VSETLTTGKCQGRPEKRSTPGKQATTRRARGYRKASIQDFNILSSLQTGVPSLHTGPVNKREIPHLCPVCKLDTQYVNWTPHLQTHPWFLPSMQTGHFVMSSMHTVPSMQTGVPSLHTGHSQQTGYNIYKVSNQTGV